MSSLRETLAASLLIGNGPRQGQRVPLTDTLRVGRHPYNDLSIEDPAASRYHACIHLAEAKPLIEDLESSNGTFVNATRVKGKAELRPGDVIRIGSTELTFRIEA